MFITGGLIRNGEHCTTQDDVGLFGRDLGAAVVERTVRNLTGECGFRRSSEFHGFNSQGYSEPTQMSESTGIPPAAIERAPRNIINMLEFEPFDEGLYCSPWKLIHQ